MISKSTVISRTCVHLALPFLVLSKSITSSMRSIISLRWVSIFAPLTHAINVISSDPSLVPLLPPCVRSALVSFAVAI